MKKRIAFLILIIVACYFIDKNSFSMIETFLICTIGVILGVVLLGMLYDLYIKLCVKRRNAILMINNKDELTRDIDVTYTPAVLSYLMNQKIEAKKDIVATLLKLYGENTINIYQQEGKYIFEKGNKEKELDSDERYIYNCFTQNEELDINEWIKKVKEEYKKYEFSLEKENLKTKSKRFKIKYVITTLILLVIVNIIAYLFYKIPVEYFAAINAVIIVINAIVFFTIYILQISLFDSNIYLSPKGKEEVLKWMNFKKFIDDYTLIENRTIEETKLFEKYLPYSMALNINKAYKNKKIDVIEIDEFIKFIVNNYIKNDIWNMQV